MTITGTTGDDNLTGPDTDTVFELGQGGADTAVGGAGNDTFRFGAGFDATDRIDGGGGQFNALELEGDYRKTVRLQADTIDNLQFIFLADGFSYRLKFDDGNLDGDERIAVWARSRTGEVVLDGSAEATGRFDFHGGGERSTLLGGDGDDRLYGGLGDDLMVGGRGDDYIWLDYVSAKRHGSDTISGGGGSDTVMVKQGLNRGDLIDGGVGEDAVMFMGERARPVTLTDQFKGIENFIFTSFSHSIHVILRNGATAPGVETYLSFFGQDGTTTGAGVRFDGSAERNSPLFLGFGDYDDIIIGGDGADTVYGGDGWDQITGGGGADRLIGSGNQDNFIYRAASDSTADAPDVLVTDYHDVLDLRLIDADVTRDGNQAFRMVSAFTGKAGQIVVAEADSGRREMSLDVDGDAIADSVILIDGNMERFVL